MFRFVEAMKKGITKDGRTSQPVINAVPGVLETRVRLVAIDDIEDIIHSFLMAPKTVFVSAVEFFQSDWNYFHQAMKADKALKFARHYDRERTVFQTNSFYGFTKGLHPTAQNRIPRRLKAVVSSGMLGLWRKWKRLRIELHKKEI